MISNINDRLLYAIQNYFYTRHHELFSSNFIEPKSKKIQKTTELASKPARSRHPIRERKPSSGIRGARKRQEVSERPSAEAAHPKIVSSPLVTASHSFA